MKNNEVKKIQMGGYSGKNYKDIRSKVKKFEDEQAVRHVALRKKKKVKCRSNAHEFVLERRPIGIRDTYWEFYTCKKCGKFKMKWK